MGKRGRKGPATTRDEQSTPKPLNEGPKRGKKRPRDGPEPHSTHTEPHQKKKRPEAAEDQKAVAHKHKDRKRPTGFMSISEAVKLQKMKGATVGRKRVSASGTSTPTAAAAEEVISPEEAAKYVGLDCEMVGVGISGKRSVLARVCVVDFEGKIIYDSFVKVAERVTDFRTKFSGVRPRNLKEEGVSFDEAAKKVAKLLRGKVLVGHALKNDLKVLMITHPRHMIRDTATYRPLMRFDKGTFKPRKLKHLAKQYLGEAIQEGEHTPDEDASAAMRVYRVKRKEWEAHVRIYKGSAKKSKRTVKQA